MLELSSNFFHTNRLSFFKIQNVIKSPSLTPGASNLAILMFSTCYSKVTYEGLLYFPISVSQKITNSSYTCPQGQIKNCCQS